MKVKLLKQNRIDGEAGEIVEVSPDRAEFLFWTEAAVPAEDAGEQADKPETKAGKKAEPEAKTEPKVLKKPEKKAAKEEPKIVKTAKSAAKKK